LSLNVVAKHGRVNSWIDEIPISDKRCEEALEMLDEKDVQLFTDERIH